MMFEHQCVWGKEVAVSSVRELLTEHNAGVEPRVDFCDGGGNQMQDSELPKEQPSGTV